MKKTEAKAIRLGNIANYESIPWRQAPTKGIDNGAGFRAQELKDAPKNSLKTDVSCREKHDNDRWVIGLDGKRHKAEFESKGNGGRLDHIMEMAAKGGYRYVVYTLDVCNKNTGYERRTAPQIVVPADVFMAAAERLGAIKTNRHNGVVRGYSLQHTLKAWYQWVLEYPVKFAENEKFEAWMFEGLE